MSAPTLFSSASQLNYDLRMNHSHSRAFPPHPVLEPPRPMEPPRPVHQLQPSLSDASSSFNRWELSRNAGMTPSNARQSLPGLRDILPPSPSIHALWQGGPTPPTSQPASDTYFRPLGLHPPLSLPWSPKRAYQATSAQRLELPIRGSSPPARPLSQSVPVSPYTSYPEAREHAEGQHESAVQMRHPFSVVHNSHDPLIASAAAEEQLTPRTAPSVELSSRTGSALTSAESHGKCLGVKEFRGEGTFYVYEDGHRIPTHVDGEQVNPAWGLTKANKPRKRLALACLDCREKKIKCEPGANSCLQCEKAKRPCRRAPVQQSQDETSLSSPWTSSTASQRSKGFSDPTPSGSRDFEADIINKRRLREETSPVNLPTKKHRSTSPSTAVLSLGMNGNEAGRGVDASSTAHSSPRPGGPRLSWEEDPFTVDCEITLYLLDIYFTHINNATYCMLPRTSFMRWAKTSTDKCQNERMVLYAMLAVASIFADQNLAGFGKQCMDIASHAVSAQLGRFNLCVVQSRILLSLCYYAKGNYGAAWDMSGQTVRTATSYFLRWNTEPGCCSDADSRAHARIEFDYSAEQLAECKRRAFWSCFLMDRFSRGTHCVLNLGDIFLRLPCSNDDFERSKPSRAPFFSNGIVDPAETILTPSSPISPMAWLVLITAIWGDVMNFTYRSVYRPSSHYRDAYERFYADIYNAVQEWHSRLPEYLRFNPTNLDRSIQEGHGNTFVSMHAVHNFTLMKLNRCVRHSAMMDIVPRNIRAARFHAYAALAIMKDLGEARRDIISSVSPRPMHFALVTPFLGHITMSAIDIVSAGGLDSNLGTTIEGIERGIHCIRELARVWTSAVALQQDCETRLYQIRNIVTRPYKSPGGAWLGREWGISGQSLDREFGLEDDCTYGLNDASSYSKHFFEALKDDLGRSTASSGSPRSTT